MEKKSRLEEILEWGMLRRYGFGVEDLRTRFEITSTNAERCLYRLLKSGKVARTESDEGLRVVVSK